MFYSLFSLRNLIKLNGAYDVLCALTMLNIVYIPVLNNLHLSMFFDRDGDRGNRMFAYWVFTYGVIRLFGGSAPLVSYSYYLEALAFLNEVFHGSVYKGHAFFVIISSTALGLLAHQL
jgi:hypothetical protein